VAVQLGPRPQDRGVDQPRGRPGHRQRCTIADDQGRGGGSSCPRYAAGAPRAGTVADTGSRRRGGRCVGTPACGRATMDEATRCCPSPGIAVDAERAPAGRIRDVKVLGREEAFASAYRRGRGRMARAEYVGDTAMQLPSIVLEMALLGFILTIFATTIPHREQRRTRCPFWGCSPTWGYGCSPPCR
jgi:hypothetical protein